MIQVIGRVFTILEELSLDGEVSLDSLARITGLNKGTLCNILRSLIELGYVSRTRGSHYELTTRFAELTAPEKRSAAETEVLNRTVISLANATEESGVLAALRGGRVAVVSQAQYQRALMVNAVDIYAALSLYHSVSGRILVSYLPTGERAALCAKHGFPGEKWDGITASEELEKACAKIRKDGLSVMKNPGEGIIAFAVPVFLRNGRTMSLGLTMPLMRCTPDKRREILAELQEHADKLSTSVI
jgi:DNA-binding IclR family transcriptional regulator